MDTTDVLPSDVRIGDSIIGTFSDDEWHVSDHGGWELTEEDHFLLDSEEIELVRIVVAEG